MMAFHSTTRRTENQPTETRKLLANNTLQDESFLRRRFVASLTSYDSLKSIRCQCRSDGSPDDFRIRFTN